MADVRDGFAGSIKFAGEAEHIRIAAELVGCEAARNEKCAEFSFLHITDGGIRCTGVAVFPRICSAGLGSGYHDLPALLLQSHFGIPKLQILVDVVYESEDVFTAGFFHTLVLRRRFVEYRGLVKMMAEKYWLMKSEPDVFSIGDLARKGVSAWDGVRNYQARNFMRDHMRLGDRVLFYHSSIQPPGVAGLARVCREAYPDSTAWDKSSPYHDEKSTPTSPRWFMVDVSYEETFPHFVTLDEMRSDAKLEGLLVLQRGQRLSVQPVSRAHFVHVVELGRRCA